MNRLHPLRHRAVPYALAAPAVLFLLVFFAIPGLYLIQTSLQTGSFEMGYRFDWAWANFGAAVADYTPHLLRSLLYAGAATALALVIAYPLMYWIARRGGRWKPLLLLCVVAPFFVTFLIRTLAWQTILQDDGPIVSALRATPLLGDADGLLATPIAVIGGLTYNFLPLMALPLYATLDKIDGRLLEAANDLYASPAVAFVRVTLPLSLPGVIAGCLLTFIPACGDYVNAALLGSPDTAMIGNVIQSKFLQVADYPTAAALSCVVMAGILAIVIVWLRGAGARKAVTL
jgi:spermidine/putrescine transport system permease protein